MTHLTAQSSGFPEHRYIVIKEADLYEAGRSGLLTIGQLTTLVTITSAVDAIRHQNHKPTLKTIVIEEDWPEYPATVSALAARVQSVLNAVENGSCS